MLCSSPGAPHMACHTTGDLLCKHEASMLYNRSRNHAGRCHPTRSLRAVRGRMGAFLIEIDAKVQGSPNIPKKSGARIPQYPQEERCRVVKPSSRPKTLQPPLPPTTPCFSCLSLCEHRNPVWCQARRGKSHTHHQPKLETAPQSSLVPHMSPQIIRGMYAGGRSRTAHDRSVAQLRCREKSVVASPSLRVGRGYFSRAL